MAYDDDDSDGMLEEFLYALKEELEGEEVSDLTMTRTYNDYIDILDHETMVQAYSNLTIA